MYHGHNSIKFCQYFAISNKKKEDGFNSLIDFSNFFSPFDQPSKLFDPQRDISAVPYRDKDKHILQEVKFYNNNLLIIMPDCRNDEHIEDAIRYITPNNPTVIAALSSDDDQFPIYGLSKWIVESSYNHYLELYPHQKNSAQFYLTNLPYLAIIAAGFYSNIDSYHIYWPDLEILLNKEQAREYLENHQSKFLAFIKSNNIREAKYGNITKIKPTDKDIEILTKATFIHACSHNIPMIYTFFVNHNDNDYLRSFISSELDGIHLQGIVFSPFNTAAITGNFELTKWLYENAVDKEQLLNKVAFALCIIYQKSYDKIGDFIIEQGINACQAIYSAYTYNSKIAPKIINLLLDKNLDVHQACNNLQDYQLNRLDDFNIVKIIVAYGKVEDLQLLEERVNLKLEDEFFTYAIDNENLKVLEYLLSKGVHFDCGVMLEKMQNIRGDQDGVYRIMFKDDAENLLNLYCPNEAAIFIAGQIEPAEDDRFPWEL